MQNCIECESAISLLHETLGDEFPELKNLHYHMDGDWLRIKSDQALTNSSIGNEINGKYLFFSESLPSLLEIAQSEIENHNFHWTKIALKPAGNSRDRCLCLYFADDSRKHELAERMKTAYTTLPVKYRYWKSNEDTNNGRYSRRYKDSFN